MKSEDQQLSALLKHWPDIEPAADFEASVWRRIRLVDVEQPTRASLFGLLLRRWLWQPAWATVTAVLIGMLAGTWGGVKSVPKSAEREIVPFQFLTRTTLAGGYFSMTEGTRQ